MFLVMWKPNGTISPLCLMNCLNGLYETGSMNLTRLWVLFSYAIAAMSILGGVT